jgi:ribonuclease Z
MKAIFLGTNGWYDSPTGNTVSILLEAEETTVILDAGNGISKLDRFSGLDKPAFLFLSHLHLDHVSGFHVFPKLPFRQGLTICGSKGVERELGDLLRAPFTVPLGRLPFSTRFVELPEEEGTLPFPVRALPLVHASPCLGFRLVLDGRIVTYCTDTGYCENAVELARNADLLITECAFKPGQESTDWPHLNPETAGRIAREAKAKQLVLVHFDAHLYGKLSDRDDAVAEVARHFPNVTAARDEMVVELTPG